MNRFNSGFFALTPVVKNILIINLLLFIADNILESGFGIRISEYLGLHFPESERFNAFQFLSYMFLHADINHIFVNMLAVFFFGRTLESKWGSQRFLSFYLITGIGAGLIHLCVGWINYASMTSIINDFNNTANAETFNLFIKKFICPYRTEYTTNIINALNDFPDNQNAIKHAQDVLYGSLQYNINIPTIGASGSVFGILLGFGMLFPNAEIFLMFIPIPIKAKYMVIGYGLIELYSGIYNSGDNIAHFAHLGGMLFGIIVLYYWKKKYGSFY
ncbi:MAG: rhomboid family intramembrane serine protease [Marinifilaceae bacterium]|jgi:membrane associated rhomboid family serine protease|nr:rhomboid family intramembrane serine protease [Marinifilaceae bacterium]